MRNDEFLRKQLPRAPPGVLQEVGNVLVDGAAVIMIVVVVVVRVERLGRMEVLPSTSGPPPPRRLERSDTRQLERANGFVVVVVAAERTREAWNWGSRWCCC